MSADYDQDDNYGFDYGYEPDWDDDLRDPMDGYEPDPTDHPEFARYEYERYLRTLSPAERIAERARALVWRYTWRWQMKARARWLLVTGRATAESEEPPF